MRDLRLEVTKLNRHWDRAVKENSVMTPDIVTCSPDLAAARSPAGYPANGPMGHSVASSHRDNGFGSVTTWTHVPVTGMIPPTRFDVATPSSTVIRPVSTPRVDTPRHGHHPPLTGRLPKLLFPRFDGYNPRIWCSRCEKYFHMYDIDPSLCVRVAEMHFDGPTAR